MKHLLFKKMAAAGLAAIMLFSIAPAARAEGSGSGYTTSDAAITLNVVEADVRDVLSAIALSMGSSVIYQGQPVPVTISLTDTARSTRSAMSATWLASATSRPPAM